MEGAEVCQSSFCLLLWLLCTDAQADLITRGTWPQGQ